MSSKVWKQKSKYFAVKLEWLNTFFLISIQFLCSTFKSSIKIVINSLQLDDIDNVPNDVTEILTKVLNYVNRIYIRGVTAKRGRRAILPRFPPIIWNVYNLVLKKQQRSTNNVERVIKRNQQMIETIVSKYHSQKGEMNVIGYLKAIRYKLKLQIPKILEAEVKE